MITRKVESWTEGEDEIIISSLVDNKKRIGEISSTTSILRSKNAIKTRVQTLKKMGMLVSKGSTASVKYSRPKMAVGKITKNIEIPDDVPTKGKESKVEKIPAEEVKDEVVNTEKVNDIPKVKEWSHPFLPTPTVKHYGEEYVVVDDVLYKKVSGCTKGFESLTFKTSFKD